MGKGRTVGGRESEHAAGFGVTEGAVPARSSYQIKAD